MKLKSSRGIVMKLICCTALVVLASAVAFSQTPKSGALLTIDGTGASNGVHVKLYDSQIHSGNVQVVPTGNGSNCVAGDQVPTDAYVLQGGAPTGCDPNDPFEVTENNNSLTHQDFGQKNLFGFHFETHYLSVPVVSISGVVSNNGDGSTTYSYSRLRGNDIAAGENIAIGGFDLAGSANNGNYTISSVTSGSFIASNPNGVPDSGQNATGTASGASAAVCNTNNTICASPDTGFLTVTNTTASDFTGTFSLTGTSATAGGDCPLGGAASDSVTQTLLANSGSSVTLALSKDSSNCGGFNQAQTLVLSPNVLKTAFFGKDDYQITTLNSATGDTLSVLPVPVPAGPLGQTGFGPFPYNFTGCGSNCTSFNPGQFGTETPSLSSPLRFSAGTNPNLGGTKLACVPYADFSADGNPVCAELQIECANGLNDCSDGFFYNVQNDFDIDGFSLPGGIGGPAFLGHHQVDCPNSAFDQNIFLKYTPASVTFGDPLKGGGSGTPSCWVVAFDPSAATVTTGSVSSFTGFSGLFPPPTLNPVNRAQAVPLNFTFPTAGLHLCTSVNNPSPTCSGPGSNGAATPWVSFGTFPIDCGTGVVTPGSTEVSIVAGSSNLQTISSTPSLTSYRFNWKPQKTAPLNGCVVVVTQFSNGLVVFPDDFKYIK